MILKLGEICVLDYLSEFLALCIFLKMKHICKSIRVRLTINEQRLKTMAMVKDAIKVHLIRKCSNFCGVKQFKIIGHIGTDICTHTPVGVEDLALPYGPSSWT